MVKNSSHGEYPPLKPDKRGRTKTTCVPSGVLKMGCGGRRGPNIALCSPAVKEPLSCWWTESYVGERYQGIVLLNVELVKCQFVHEGLYYVVCGEVEDQAKKNGNGQSRKRLLENGEEQQGQTQANEDGYKAGQRGVPVATGRGRGLSHQHAVEDKISKAQLDAPLLIIIFRRRSCRGHLLDLPSGLLGGLERPQLMFLLVDPGRGEASIVL